MPRSVYPLSSNCLTCLFSQILVDCLQYYLALKYISEVAYMNYFLPCNFFEATMKIIKRNLAVQLYTSNFVKAQFPSSFLQKQMFCTTLTSELMTKLSFNNASRALCQISNSSKIPTSRNL